ncbi:unnamed protein product, partial [Heterosigma akashiwo]
MDIELDNFSGAKTKLDELFVYWLCQKSTTALIEGYINDVVEGKSLEKPANPQLLLASYSSHPSSPIGAASAVGGVSPIHPPKSPSYKDVGFDGSPLRIKNFQSGSPRAQRFEKFKNFSFENEEKETPSHTRSHSALSRSALSVDANDLSGISQRDDMWKLLPQFYFPGEGGRGRGIPNPGDTLELRMEDIKELFTPFGEEGPNMDDFVQVTKTLCGFPSFFNAILFKKILNMAAAGALPGFGVSSPPQVESARVPLAMFCAFWRQEIEPHDHVGRFFRLVKNENADAIRREDFEPFVRELLMYHPGLEFLESHGDFHPKYMTTVITRFFYEVNTSGSGAITERELRRSNLIEAFVLVDEEEDINKVTDYFSYEHFYVLFCRFYELDGDRDGRISREDLMKYGEHGLSQAIVDRVFQVGRRPFEHCAAREGPGEVGGGGDGAGAALDRSVMTYEDFIFFMLSEEDKGNPTSLAYWFRCVDLDESGRLTLAEMKYFYEVQEHRMEALGHETVAFHDLICQMWDLIKVGHQYGLSLEDLTDPDVIQQSGVFFDALFNLNKFIGFEQRDPFGERQKRNDPFDTEWGRFAFHDYNRLAAEDEGGGEEGEDEEGMEVEDDW